MRITLSVIAGPHQGQQFTFAGHDTFLVGRSRHAHFQLPLKDKFFSRIHFMVEVNPPQCRLIDMGSHNGTYVNGTKILTADLKDGDEIRAGHTVLRLAAHAEGSEILPAAPPKTGAKQEAKKHPTIAGYKLMRLLGRGPLGTVYLATRLADKAKVALKVIRPAQAAPTKQRERFLHETRTLTQLDHPHIVRFFTQGQTRGLLYFVMEYVAGTDAAHLLQKKGPLPIRRAVRIIIQVLRALEYAHSLGVVHRDIKPGNLLIGKEGDKEIVKLADFGLARIYQGSQLSGLTITGETEGSLDFLPPEQITNYKSAQPPADQYATAATLYNLLTGQQVYDWPKKIHRRFSLILQSQPVPIQDRRPDINPQLAAVIHKALSRNPAQRFASAGEFRRALARAVLG